MKKITTIAVLALLFAACSDTKKEEKTLKESVLNFHEQVMADDEKAMINKMKLDTLIMQAKAAKADTATLKQLSTALVTADDAMGNWMSKLDVEYANADHNQVMKYWQDQQKQVKNIDSMLVTATSAASAYLGKIKK
ncbi:hypothetical protein KXQ82_19180 [Mucilaginibacter sp. HMF5004]|uniref:hypothetical protein n=1 Tax=Mucilaginibacter rivuli TaxID=2857527 RepID=UPI001C5ED42F|nr:hypothetical protein [Mucilaginibacter rivuli]MBW4891858.1 hypothetical protein [Mucilaginibacter rivuli]